MMNQLFGNSLLFGGNAPFVEELYENYLGNPAAVPGEWREYFEKLAQLPGATAHDIPHLPIVHAFAEQAKTGGYCAAAARPVDDKKQVSVLQMISAYRTLGARWANLDPLKRQKRPELNELEPTYYGLTDADINTLLNRIAQDLAQSLVKQVRGCMQARLSIRIFLAFTAILIIQPMSAKLTLGAGL